MHVIRATQQMLETRTLVLGFQGENLRTQLRIDCAATFAEYPNATPALAIKPPSGATYPVFVERDGNEVVWDIVANNLALKGDGELQLTFYKDNVIAKTSIGHITVNRSLQIDGEMPDVVATWIENANRKLAEVDAQIVELEGMVDTATDAATRAEQSASTASTKAEQAAGSAATATEKATEATNAAGTATAKAAEAQTAAQTATTKATAAADSERIATAKAVEATTAAGTATTKAEQATEAAQTATEKARDASASATAAHASEINAAESADGAFSAEVGANAAKRAAETSATQAGISEQNAGIAAQTATQKAAEATQSATNAAIFAGTATTKAEEAAESAQAASDAQTAVEQTAEQLADSLEQIDQNTQDIAELDERKANIDGYYPDMTVGNAEQLNSSKYVENSEPYTLRTSGGTSDIGNREYVDAVVGGTLAWNQMVRDEASENSTDFADVVTVTDAVEDAAGVKVKIEPVQDLHGYDHPWPAGGGKNKFVFSAGRSAYQWDDGCAISAIQAGDDFFIANGTAAESSHTFTVPNAVVVLPAGTYTVSHSALGKLQFVLKNEDDTNIASCLTSPQSFTLGEETTIKLQFSLLVGQTFNSEKIYIQIESGSSATAWTPYSNICPITGWDEVKVTRTGKNLWNKDDPTAKNGYYNLDGSFNYNSAWRAIAFSCQQGFTYTKSGDGWGGIVTYWYDDTFVSSTNAPTVTVPSGVNNVRFACQYSSTNAQLELSSTATDYEPYAGQTYDITLPTEAGTVYGGELTVNEDGTGTLKAELAKKVINGNERFWAYASNETYAHMVFETPDSMKDQNQIMCDKLRLGGVKPYTNSGEGVWQGGSYTWYICVKKDLLESDDSAGFSQWLANNNLTCIYKLATPITYTLTASQIRTLLGENNVWADTGDIALTYTGTDEHLTLESGKKYLARISGTDSMLLGSGQEITAAKGTDNVFDLTRMFGTAVADYVYGQGAAFFRKWFPKPLYLYNAGELKHVEGLQSHDMVGFNLWDEEWEGGGYQNTTGEKVPNSSCIRSKNFIPIIPLQTYYFKFNSTAVVVIGYDADKNFVQVITSKTASGAFTLTKSNVCYITFYLIGTTYNHDICISLAHNNSRNGEYEPYEKHSYPLDSTVILRGIPKVDANGVYWDGDRYLPDGTVERRYGVVDLGTLEWKYSNFPVGKERFETTLNIKGSSEVIPNVVVKLYTPYTFNWIYSMGQDKGIGVYGSSGTVVIRDTDYTNAATFKAAMSGVLLVYELATPTTETAQPYHSTQWVSDWGTEEFVSTGIVPVGSETRYPANLRDKLQHLPDAASGNGSYLITQTDGQMVLTPFPAPPSTAGNYVLKATVVNGVATYTWEVAT